MTDTLKYNFYCDDKKILICNHCTPFVDGLWLHNTLQSMKLEHFIYTRYCFNYESEWLRPIHCPGFVEREVKYLKSTHKCCAVIFPSGGTIHWKSGFYNLARFTNIPVYVVQLDYIDNQINIINRIIIADESFEDVKHHCISLYHSHNKTPVWSKILYFFGYGDEAIII